MLASLEDLAFSKWLLGSNSIWAYPTVLTLHTIGMMVLVGAAMMIDLRLLGFGRGIPLGSMRALFRMIWAGLSVNVVTGLMLFVADATKRGPSAIFWVKLSLIAVGVVTVVLINRDLNGGKTEPAVVSRSLKRLAVGSLLLWSAATTAGRLLAYVV